MFSFFIWKTIQLVIVVDRDGSNKIRRVCGIVQRSKITLVRSAFNSRFCGRFCIFMHGCVQIWQGYFLGNRFWNSGRRVVFGFTVYFLILHCKIVQIRSRCHGIGVLMRDGGQSCRRIQEFYSECSGHRFLVVSGRYRFALFYLLR